MTDEEKNRKTWEMLKAEEEQHRATRELLKAMENDRDQWKGLAQLADQKLVALQNSMREALEASE